MRYVLVASVVLIASCLDDEATIKHAGLVGAWEVKQVTLDGVLKSEWTGLSLVIEAKNFNSGIYHFRATPDPAIFSSEGIWQTDREGSVLLDNNTGVDVAFTTTSLSVSKLLPGTGGPVCENGICLPVVTGAWQFEFSRK